MIPRRNKVSCNEEEYEKKLKELDNYQNFISIADKLILPDDLIKKIIEETLLKTPQDPLIPKKKPKPLKPQKPPKKRCEAF
jgi:hypothetical protein